MKVVKSCDQAQISVASINIQKGTVFRYRDHTCGPYLKVDRGYVNLSNFTYWPDHPRTFDNYVELPNATLVTGEK